MTPTLHIALRFLLHRKRAFILSLCGVVFGVAIFVCTQAQTPEAILAEKVLAREDLARCEEVGAAMAAGLAMGVF